MVSESRGNCFVCSWFAVLAVAALTAWVLGPTAFAEDCAYEAPDPTLRDCNGNGIDDAVDPADTDGDGIPEECEFQICDNLWNGFVDDPPFEVEEGVDGIDYDGDGIAWQNPEGTALITDEYGCPNEAVFLTPLAPSGTPPSTPDGYVDSEYFRTLGGELDCGLAAKYSLAFRYSILYPDWAKYDWMFYIKDAVSGGLVMQIEFIAYESARPHVSSFKGHVVVKNPAGGYIDTGVELEDETCFDMQVVLDNVTRKVQLYIDGVPVLATPLDPLDANARRMDYFRACAVYNSYSSGTTTRLSLDTFQFCITGPALMDWYDCNGNCIDDDVEIANTPSLDSSPANGYLDACDGVENCSCEGRLVPDPSVPCNHDHEWDFGSFAIADIDCQQGWVEGLATQAGIGEIVNYSNGPLTGKVLKLNAASGMGVDPQCIHGPRTHDEQPDNPDETGDASLEYWEVDIVVNPRDNDGQEVYFVVWDECHSFVHPDPSPNSYPTCFTATAPTCLLLDEAPEPGFSENIWRTYAYINAGVRFRYYNAGTAQKVNILAGGAWTSNVSGSADWENGVPKHINIKINNDTGRLSYFDDPFEWGRTDSGQIHLSGTTAGNQNSSNPGDRQVTMFTTSNVSVGHFDNLTYTLAMDCDHDEHQDSIYLPGGVYYSYLQGGTNPDTNDDGIVDWCQDCNRNCVVDATDIAGPTSEDCNDNGVPDECDTNYWHTLDGGTLPDTIVRPAWKQNDPPTCTTPWGHPAATGYYTLLGGGSEDVNTNGIPDECETDCNGNGTLDYIDIAGSTSEDCNDNDVPDECDIAAGSGGSSQDCNTNDVPDECDIDAGTSGDCNGNDVPDECDITAGTSTDCNSNGAAHPNGLPDECEVASDCNANEIADGCDIADCPPDTPACDDCTDSNTFMQPNGIPDECDIASGYSEDTNENGIPDECEAAPPANLIDSEPDDANDPAHQTLCKEQNNCILLTFDADLAAAPTAGEIEIKQLLEGGGYGSNLSENFTYALEDENGDYDPRKLKITETGAVLGDQVWFEVGNTGWTAAADFTLQYIVQVGDVDNNGRVMAGDLSPIFPMIPTASVDCTVRENVDGNAHVMAGDLSPVFPKIPSNYVPKPGGH